MNTVLKQNESEIKKWRFEEKVKGRKYENDIVITDKRFIYQRDLTHSAGEKSINRKEVPLDMVRGFSTFYGASRSPLGKIFMLLGIIAFVLGLVVKVTAITVVGAIFAVLGIILWILLKKPTFNLELHTTPIMAGLSFGAGKWMRCNPGDCSKDSKRRTPSIFLKL